MPNKINPYSEFALRVQAEVLLKLNDKNLTTNELTKTLHRPYHTIRQAVLELENNGTIVPVNKSYRNTKYKVADGTVVTDRILPTVQINNDVYKITRVLATWKRETKAELAARNLPLYITRVLKVAERLFNKEENAVNVLVLIRREMEMDRDAIANLLSVYDQLLRNGKIWSPDHLKNFPNDTDWNKETLDEAYKHFFGDSTD